MTPNIRFIIDIKADTKNCMRFIKGSKFVDWFLPLNFQYITSKKFSLPEKNKIIQEYTRYFYKINKDKIKKGVKETNKRWNLVENKFYKLVNNIFKGYPWPKGQYTGIASIYLMFPRDIKWKTFYFPFTNTKCDPITVIAHEMLHFIFFDYIKNKYNINEKDEFKGKKPEYIWQISETFNTVIENYKPYNHIIKAKGKPKPYPGTEKMYKQMKQQWNKKQDIEILLDKWLKKENF